ncbi:MAG: aminoglycoside phosphotransferase [Gaeavirus sp.]|uniref:Aminoglycoside phosphotransferase n=1 Tax=Gaeavirus sp. TaxID=2487767 RepID=A0A3G5A448_9VIRU|nr:MAG: aminoglycoside phosphotransferase [Gaeavirus sp.]
MNIIIPIGGKGERFKNNGYSEPKPLIKVFDKQMIFYVIDNLKIKEQDKIFIIYYDLDNLEDILCQKYNNINFIKIDKQTQGAAETIAIGLDKIRDMTDLMKCVLLDCDTFYTQDVLKICRDTKESCVFYTLNYETKQIYSYIELDDDSKIKRIAEKVKISDNANTGIYCFNNINQLHHYSKHIVSNDIKFNNECYTSCIIDKMISDNIIFKGLELRNEHVFNLGTPDQLNEYIKNTHAFLFDLDGTLVLTDEIYFDVWTTILKDYNINLTTDIFTSYIQGNSDNTVLQSLLPGITLNISDTKDNLFLKNIHKIRIIDGIHNFLNQIKSQGHKIAIVTNCNRQIAEEILNYININYLIDKLVIGNECTRSKPYSDPYIQAIKFFNTTNDKAIIFEDSKTGIQSGKSTFPKCLIGIETLYNSTELINNGTNLTIKNYSNIDINIFLNYNNMNMETIKNYIKSSITNINITSIDILDDKLKGGFISDVIALKIHTDNDTLDCVLKLENKNETFLSKMANDLGLYEREYYFYNSLSKYVPINTPNFYGLIKDEQFNNIGILMQNLINQDYKLNLNLNKEKIDVSLKIIDSIAVLHAKFWNKDLQKNFKELKKHNDQMFNPKWDIFIKDNWPKFKLKWSGILNATQLSKAQKIVDNFSNIQNSLSNKNLTLCHGDVKSANIFYKTTDSGYEPYFIDWQYICMGKGVQDLVFFMIESFEIDVINRYKNVFKEYYYIKLQENGITDYDIDDYNTDFENSIYYFPFFVAIWFGTVNEDELIDKNFPFFFIQKLFNFI